MGSVVIGIINKDNKLLMIKRVKKEGSLEWAFPGGKVEKDETNEQACIREVFEETNINISINKCLGIRVHPNTNVEIVYYLCDFISGTATILDDNEVNEIAYKTLDEFYRDIKTDVYPPVKEYIRGHIK